MQEGFTIEILNDKVAKDLESLPLKVKVCNAIVFLIC